MKYLQLLSYRVAGVPEIRVATRPPSRAMPLVPEPVPRWFAPATGAHSSRATTVYLNLLSLLPTEIQSRKTFIQCSGVWCSVVMLEIKKTGSFAKQIQHNVSHFVW